MYFSCIEVDKTIKRNRGNLERVGRNHTITMVPAPLLFVCTERNSVCAHGARLITDHYACLVVASV
jgi:hypothetical protein